MTWVSLVCLLALSSAAFGRSVSFDGYGSTRIIEPTPLPAPAYGRELLPAPELTRISSGYGSSFVAPTRVLSAPSYGGYGSTNRLLERSEIIVDPLPPTPADILCRGQLPQTVIPIEGNRKFVTCLDDGKGVEQTCPRGLLFHELTRRCERKLGALEDFCLSQPCLNGGLCISGDSTFTCQCPTGFDGMNCELDASFCHLNRPCGSDSFVRCQSFRPNAALQWICVADDDFTYGPDGAHIHKSFCDGSNMGPFPLAYTNKGFMMCNGEHTHYESCPGGTIWDASAKACVWPDMEEGGETRIISKPGYGGYGSTLIAPPARVFERYDKVIVPPRPKFISSYGGEVRRLGGYGGEILPPPMPETRVITSSYGGEVRRLGGYGGEILPPPMPETKFIPSSYGGEVRRVGGYGGDVVLPAPMPETKIITSSYGGEVRRVGGYGGDVILPPTKTFSSYGGEVVVPPTKTFSSYGGEVVVPPTRTLTGYGETFPVPETKFITNSYGSSRLIPSVPIVKTAPSYGGY